MSKPLLSRNWVFEVVWHDNLVQPRLLSAVGVYITSRRRLSIHPLPLTNPFGIINPLTSLFIVHRPIFYPYAHPRAYCIYMYFFFSCSFQNETSENCGHWIYAFLFSFQNELSRWLGQPLISLVGWSVAKLRGPTCNNGAPGSLRRYQNYDHTIIPLALTQRLTHHPPHPSEVQLYTRNYSAVLRT